MRQQKRGNTQESVLRLLKERGGEWFHGCGWKWDTPGYTDRIMAALARKGLVDRITETTDGYGHYRLTAEGMKA